MSFTWCLTYSRLCGVTCGSEPRACSQRGSRGCGGAHVVAWVGSRPLARPGARPEAGLGWRPRKAAALRGELRVVGEPPPLGPPGPAPSRRHRAAGLLHLAHLSGRAGGRTRATWNSPEMSHVMLAGHTCFPLDTNLVSIRGGWRFWSPRRKTGGGSARMSGDRQGSGVSK